MSVDLAEEHSLLATAGQAAAAAAGAAPDGAQGPQAPAVHGRPGAADKHCVRRIPCAHAPGQRRLRQWLQGWAGWRRRAGQLTCWGASTGQSSFTGSGPLKSQNLLSPALPTRPFCPSRQQPAARRHAARVHQLPGRASPPLQCPWCPTMASTPWRPSWAVSCARPLWCRPSSGRSSPSFCTSSRVGGRGPCMRAAPAIWPRYATLRSASIQRGPDAARVLGLTCTAAS